MAPFFSIVIPTFNRAQLLTKAVNSVLQQTFTNWELVIVDDGSTDNTKQVVENFKDKRINYLYQQNAERSVARNNGIKNASGTYICFLDSDDYYLPSRLEKMHAEIAKQNEPVALYYTGIAYEKANVITAQPEIDNTFSTIGDFIVQVVIGTPQTCIHRTILQKHSFNPTLRIGEDMELWLRITSEFPLIHLANQITIVALDHEDRSVNVKRDNIYFNAVQLFKYVFKKNHPGHRVSENVKAKVIGNCYYGTARYYIYQQKRFLALFYLATTIAWDTKTPLLKFRINVFIKLLFFVSFKKVEELIA